MPSITCRDSFLLSFLFFHWLSSCLDRVESMEVWMEAWRRGMRPSSNEEPPWDLERREDLLTGRQGRAHLREVGTSRPGVGKLRPGGPPVDR